MNAFNATTMLVAVATTTLLSQNARAAEIVQVVQPASGCRFSIKGAAGLPLDANFNFSVDSVVAGPSFVRRMPMKLETTPDCRIRLSPDAPITQFRVFVKSDFAFSDATRPAQMLAKIESSLGSSFEVASEFQPIGHSNEVSSFEFTVASNDLLQARVLNLQLLLKYDGASQAFPIKMLWAPSSYDLKTSSLSGCPALLICYYQNTEQLVALTGASVAELDVTRKAVVRYVVPGQPANDVPTEVERNAEGLFLRIKPPINVTSISIGLPLIAPRLDADGKNQETILLVRSSQQLNLPNHELRVLNAADLATMNLIRMDQASGVGVKIVRNNLSKDEFRQLSLNKSIDLKDPLVPAPLVALLQPESVDDDTLFATIVPKAPTAKRTGNQGNPTLTFQFSNRTYTMRIAILPNLAVAKVFVGNSVEAGLILRPVDTVQVRIEGPSSRYLKSGILAGATVHRVDGSSEVDSVWFRIVTKATLLPNEPLIVESEDGLKIRIPVTVRPHAEPKPVFNYVFVRMNGLPEVSAESIRAAHEVYKLKSLANVSIRMDSRKVDSGDTLFGIQYVRISATLVDGRGANRATAQYCFAVVPDNPPSVRYELGQNCTRYSGSIELSDSLEALFRTTPKSRLTLRIEHDANRYSMPVPEAVTVAIEHKGFLVVEPRVTWPAGTLALFRGRVMPNVEYVSGGVTFQPTVLNLRGPHQLQFLTGFGFGAAPNVAAENRTLQSQLSMYGGFGYSFNGMSKNSSFELSFIGVAPITGRWSNFFGNSYLVFRPGFTYTVALPGGRSSTP